MNRMLYFGLTAVATLALAQPTYAKKGGGGGRGGGGGHAAHFSAPKGGGGRMAHFSAPKGGGRMAHFSAPKGGGRMAHFSAPKAMRGPSMAKMGARPEFKGPSRIAEARGRKFTEPKGRAPGFVAPGRGQMPGAIAQGRGGRNSTLAFGGTQRGNTNNLAFRPPNDVTRGWDRGHMQTWNHHHYRWNNGNWVIFDGGFDGGYPYGYYDGGQPYFNYTGPGYAAPGYGSGSVVANVQNALDEMGYNAGPPDGAMGPQTQNALASFQSDHQLPVTGLIDNPTLQALGL
ncbi:MAG TPA: peptidoglycan-binding domain-containing protein [Chthoniobacter sp.]|jgi:hypothetical protein